MWRRRLPSLAELVNAPATCEARRADRPASRDAVVLGAITNPDPSVSSVTSYSTTCWTTPVNLALAFKAVRSVAYLLGL